MIYKRFRSIDVYDLSCLREGSANGLRMNYMFGGRWQDRDHIAKVLLCEIILQYFAGGDPNLSKTK